MFKRGLAFALCATLCVLAALPTAAVAATANTYTIEVDVANQITTVYRAIDGAIVRQMICSTGENDRTPKGSFKLEKSRVEDRSEWYYIGAYACFVKYPTRIKGHILFHSLPYAEKNMESLDRESAARLGIPASHGCIRLRWQDAKWIAENCPDGTAVRIYTGICKRDSLRALLLKGSYTNLDGMCYDDFAGQTQPTNSRESLGPGATGEAVAALQRSLAGLGFFAGTPSGIYDNSTVAAVSRFQSAAGLTVNGLADATLVRRVETEKDITGSYTVLSPGCAGPRVTQLKSALIALGLYNGKADEFYDSALKKSIEVCQGLWGYPVTGAASGELQETLIACGATTLVMGDKAAAVQIMERALNALGYYEGCCDECFGMDTVMAVRAFTTDNGMQESADATPEIQQAILKCYQVQAGSLA